jgi:hypothetical protein
MQTITKTYSAVGVSNNMTLKDGESLLYKFDALASWDGTVILRRTRDGGITYDIIETFTATDNNGTIIEGEGTYSFQCTVFTAGTAAVTLLNLSNDQGVFTTGLPNGTTVSATESGDGLINKTILDLGSTPVSVTSITTGAGVGGTKIYDFPQGRILMLGCMADVILTIDAADQADFTDATPEGDLGIGSVAPANADALGTDATDDDFATAVAFTMAAYSDPSVQAPSEASLQFDGTSTPLDMYVNLLVDAADIDDGVTSTVYVSGKVICHWINLGDF